MATRLNTAENSAIVTRDRVTDAIRTELRTVVTIERTRSVEQIAAASGVPVRAIRTYMANDPGELREPPLSAALSIAVVLGSRAVNVILALIGYVGQPVDEVEEAAPMELVAGAMAEMATIARAAADNRFDHTERPVIREAADHMIEILTPISSLGRAA